MGDLVQRRQELGNLQVVVQADVGQWGVTLVVSLTCRFGAMAAWRERQGRGAFKLANRRGYSGARGSLMSLRA